jgi:transcription initiation protein SPT3
MFVFGEVQEPLPETVKLVEDVVRGQVIEIVRLTRHLKQIRSLLGMEADIQVTRARLLTHLRSSRFLSAEDLIFLIREDRSKVNRLRTYLSWKDVRKKAKEDVDEEIEDTDKSTLKTRKTMVKLPWEVMTPFSDFLKTLPTSMNKDEEDDDDDDEIQAHHDSMQRLRVSLFSPLRDVWRQS